MSADLFTYRPFAGGKDFWADVDLEGMPPNTRKMVERAKLADSVLIADIEAQNAALRAHLIRASAIALELQLQLAQKATP